MRSDHVETLDSLRQGALVREQGRKRTDMSQSPDDDDDYSLDDDISAPASPNNGTQRGSYDNNIGASALAEFVRWLLATRLVTSSDLPPDCWWKHPEVCDTLAGLLTERAQAVDQTAGARALVIWHEDLQKIRSFWPQWLAACRTQHQEPIDVVPRHDDNASGVITSENT